MRYSLYVIAAALAFGLAGALPASAAWECQGPAASCAKAKTAHHKSKAAYSVTKSKKHASYKKKSYKSAGYKAKSKSKTGSVAYSGGSSGMASYYWQPQRVASGGWFNPNAMTAAHKTLPFGTKVRVTNLRNGRSVTVTINDRGPYIKGRVIDLSRAAASQIGMTASGVAPISMSILGRG